MDKIKYDLNRNQRSKTRDSLIGYINSISISNMDSIRTQIGMISMITAQTDEISRNSEVNVFNNFRINKVIHVFSKINIKIKKRDKRFFKFYLRFKIITQAFDTISIIFKRKCQLF